LKKRNDANIQGLYFGGKIRKKKKKADGILFSLMSAAGNNG
jgi:hypothetical protein